MATDRELLQMALDALEHLQTDVEWQYKSPTRAMLRKVEKALRARLAHPENEFNPDWDATAIMVEEQQRMAKRIEELEAQLEQPEQEPVAWTPVSEAMPKSGVIVLACYKNRLGNVRRIRAQWTAAKTEEASGDWDFGEYDEAEDCYWTPEGWYECIDNWDEYSSVAVHEGEITHWIPMPTDPYTAPPQREWVGLNPKEISEIAFLCRSENPSFFAHAVEAKLKEKNYD